MNATVKRKNVGSDLGPRGFIRVRIVDKRTGKLRIAGDSGWKENNATTAGLNGIAAAVLGTTASWQVAGIVLATQAGTLTLSQASLAGTISHVQTAPGDVTMSVQGTGSAQILATFNGADHGSTYSIKMLGVHAACNSTEASVSLMAAADFTTSEFASDQSVNATYELRFANT